MNEYQSTGDRLKDAIELMIALSSGYFKNEDQWCGMTEEEVSARLENIQLESQRDVDIYEFVYDQLYG